MLAIFTFMGLSCYDTNITVWFRSACESNEQHDAEVDSARTAAEKDITKNSDEIIQQVDRELSFLVPLVNFWDNHYYDNHKLISL